MLKKVRAHRMSVCLGASHRGFTFMYLYCFLRPQGSKQQQHVQVNTYECVCCVLLEVLSESVSKVNTFRTIKSGATRLMILVLYSRSKSYRSLMYCCVEGMIVPYYLLWSPYCLKHACEGVAVLTCRELPRYGCIGMSIDAYLLPHGCIPVTPYLITFLL